MILDLIKKYNLHVGVRRKVTFFTMACIARGYTTYLKERVGFSYKLVGLLTEPNQIASLVNDEYVAQQMEEFLKQHGNKLETNFLKQAEELLTKYEKELVEMQEEQDSLQLLWRIASLYPDYCCTIGFYNCFWRYLGNRESTALISKELRDKIGKQRDRAGKIYPVFEKLLIKCTASLAKDQCFESDLLHYCTLNEMKKYVDNGVLTEELKKELRKRKKSCIYLTFENGEEFISTDEKLLNEVLALVFPKISHETKIVKGHCAFPGKVQGKVYNVLDKCGKEFEEGEILVAVMTSALDTNLIAKSGAVVTEEGGVLCHAAVITRELKKPCVIGTKVVTSWLKTGELVEVDATNGIVKKVG